MNAQVRCPLLGHRASAQPTDDEGGRLRLPGCGHFTVTQRLWRLLQAYPERLRRAVSLYIKENTARPSPCISTWTTSSPSPRDTSHRTA
jgi:hypothetical protein